jgi:hypothetical protein
MITNRSTFLSSPDIPAMFFVKNFLGNEKSDVVLSMEFRGSLRITDKSGKTPCPALNLSLLARRGADEQR